MGGGQTVLLYLSSVLGGGGDVAARKRTALGTGRKTTGVSKIQTLAFPEYSD